MNHSLILILGDQLSPSISSLAAGDPKRDRVLLAEVREEATQAGNHKKKLAFLFSAMRHFATALSEAGWQVDYVRLDDPDNTGSFGGEAARWAREHRADRVVVTEPGEWRVAEALRGWPDSLGLTVEVLPDDRFLTTHEEFSDWADGRKQWRMEHFYRLMRRKTGLLMDGDKPEGGQWNYDADNRKPANSKLRFPAPPRFSPDPVTTEVLDLVASQFPDHFGDLDPFEYAVTAEQANTALEHFLTHGLARFGDYQDAMWRGEPFLYHSLLGLYLNVGLLDPLRVCEAVEKAYRSGQAPLNAAEGFIRQIIGWREYVRGVYWREMPAYAGQNFFENQRPLPEFYWTGDTDMVCLAETIQQTQSHAYAHHIQRLMVTGNFALLAGVDPGEVHEWYRAVYVDAYEWVELPNTLGMSQFADGGLLASKPYAASGNYINRMSNYCSDCRYDVKKKTGPGACPFNALYWDFLVRNQEALRGNPRLAQPYRTWEKMKPEKQAEYRQSAAEFLSTLDTEGT